MDGLYWAMRRSTKAFYDAGGEDLITLGTDAPSSGNFLAGFGVHREMHVMVLAGMPEAAVLQIATQNSAYAIGQGTLIGSIETGKLADLFVVKGNPLKDITNTRNVQWVIKSGILYDPQELLDSVRGKIGPENTHEVNDWFKYDMLSKKSDKYLAAGGAINPETKLLQIDLVVADEKSDQKISLLLGTIDATAIIATDIGEEDDRPGEQVQEATAMRSLASSTAYCLNLSEYEIDELQNSREIWAVETLQKTDLFPDEYIRCQVFYPLPKMRGISILR